MSRSVGTIVQGTSSRFFPPYTHTPLSGQAMLFTARALSRIGYGSLSQRRRRRPLSMRCDRSERDYIYVWVDGIYTKVRLGTDDRLCCPGMVGARIDGIKEFIAVRDSCRKSEESWAELLRASKGHPGDSPKRRTSAKPRRP